VIEELAARIETLEQRSIGLDDLPLAELQRRLELRWEPQADDFVAIGSVHERLLADGVVHHAECNGGADVGVPNTGAYVDLVDSAGVALKFTLTTGDRPETFKFEGHVIVRADSANDTGMQGKVYCPSPAEDYGHGYTGRLYWGATANLQQWHTIPILGVVALPANVSREIRCAVKIEGGSAFGGFYHRATTRRSQFMATNLTRLLK